MVQRLVTASAISLAIGAFGTFGISSGSLGVGGGAASIAAPAMPCAPSLQAPQCILGPLSCHTRCDATAGDLVASVPGDPCTRNWGQPIEEICHL